MYPHQLVCQDSLIAGPYRLGGSGGRGVKGVRGGVGGFGGVGKKPAALNKFHLPLKTLN